MYQLPESFPIRHFRWLILLQSRFNDRINLRYIPLLLNNGITCISSFFTMEYKFSYVIFVLRRILILLIQFKVVKFLGYIVKCFSKNTLLIN